MSRKNRQSDATKYRTECYNFWINKMIRLADSSVYWEGLPDEIDPVILEQQITEAGSSIIINDPIMGPFCASNASSGNVDLYGYPLYRMGTLQNGRNIKSTPEESVIIYNNSQRVSDWYIFESMAWRLADLDVVIRVNCNLQKTVPLVPTTDSQRLSVDNIMAQIDEGQLFVPVDSTAFDEVKFKEALVMDNAKSFTADRIVAIQNEIWDRFLTLYGINNANTDKKERLITGEVNSNADEIYIYRRDRLNARERACKQMKKLFGWDVKVHYYSDMTNNENINIGEFDLNRDGVPDKNQPDIGQPIAEEE